MLKHFTGHLIFIFYVTCLHSTAGAIVNGQSIDSKFHPEFGLLNFSENGPSQGRCSGFFINDSQLITAGHCVRGESGDRKFELIRINEDGVLRSVLPISVRSAYQHEEFIVASNTGKVPGCSIGEKPIFDTKTVDLALVEFPSGTSKKWLEIDLEYSPQENALLDYFGFGTHLNPFAMILPSLALPMDTLKFGQSALWRWTSSRLALLSPDTKAFAADGDSGAPVIFNGKVVAVVNTVGTKCDTEFGEDYAIQNTATRLTQATLGPLLH